MVALTIQQESRSILHDGDVDEENDLRPLQETSKVSMSDSEFCLRRRKCLRDMAVNTQKSCIPQGPAY